MPDFLRDEPEASRASVSAICQVPCFFIMATSSWIHRLVANHVGETSDARRFAMFLCVEPDK